MATTAATTSLALTPEGVREFSRQRGEPAFLLERRLKALEAWQALSLPSKTDEIWRRVRLEGLDLEASTERQGPLAVQLSGAATGGFWGRVEEAARAVPDILKAKWCTEAYPAGERGSLTTRKGGKFHALNQALFEGGYVLHLPKAVRSERPFQAEFVTRPGKDGIFPHNLVVLEEGAEAVLIESYISNPGDAGLCNPQTEILLGKGARLRYILLQFLGPDIIHIGAHRVKVHAGGDAVFASAHLGSRISKSFLEAEMAEPGGKAVIYGLYYGLGSQQLHLDTWQHHVAPECTTDLMFKGALDQWAHAVYRGMIRLEPGAQKTDAYQQNRTLLLSDDASMHSIPGLEILANDVRCTHGATAGQIDPTMLFYLLSRGLTKFQARKMIMDGFFEEVLLKFGLADVVEPLREKIDAKIAVKE